MLQITVANRFEALRDTLLEGIVGVPSSVFVAEQVIVPSSAVRRHLTLSIADRFGICANVEFAYLAAWLWRQIGKVVPKVAESSPFASPVLTWRIFQIFGDSAFVDNFPRLASYLKQADPVARFDFSTRVAALLEQYMTYRPSWLADWSSNRLARIDNASAANLDDQAWQAALWRSITAQLGTEREHPAARFLRTVAAMEAAESHAIALPEMAHVFCLPTMPPLYIDILCQLGRWMDLRLYVLNPCREYWFEIVDGQRLSYLAVKGNTAYHESGNRLLAGLGKQTQAYIDLLLENAREAVVDDAGFQEHPSDTTLARVQNAILNLSEIEAGSIKPAPTDGSIEIHVCHSLTRELEVLQDQLLAVFAAPNPPQPTDILVVTPDLEVAAPLIDAVFGNAPADRFIPYSVTGRARSTVNQPARGLLDLLTLVSSRFPASAVFDLLQQPIISRRFGIAAEDLDVIHLWIQESGIRWGIDGHHRAQCDLPALERYSFADGLHRLFLGYALPGAVATPWHDRLPAGNVEGSTAEVLGLFARFVNDLSRIRADFSQPKLAADWVAALFRILDAFFAPDDDDIDDLGELRDTLRELHHNLARGGMTTVIALDVIRMALEALLDDPTRGGVPTGKVTFSSISSLRNLPFRIICAIGLGDGAFPTASRPAEFDLMALSPRRGDRQRRIDERNLFLDLLLAARDRLYLSYTGRSIRDNAPLPASVLVSELIETLVPAIANDPTSPTSRDEARRRIVIEHPLQPFSTRCFASDSDPRARSFNRELCDALRHGLTATPELPLTDTDAANDEDEERSAELVGAFFRAPLAEPGDEWRDVSLDTLIRFLRNPCRFLLRERLGVERAGAEAELADEEPFLADFEGRQSLADCLLPHYFSGMGDADLERLALAGLEYPPGAFGELLLKRELKALKDFAERVKAASTVPTSSPRHDTLSFDLDGESWRLSAAFADLRPAGIVRQRYDDTRATDYLTGWLSHLFLCAARPEGVARQTLWLSRDGHFRLNPCDDPNAVLTSLLHLYRRGLREPIHFFPKSAWQYIANDRNLFRAQTAWRSTRERPWGEEGNPYYRLALRGVPDPIDDDFIACADAVFGTMLRCLEDPRV